MKFIKKYVLVSHCYLLLIALLLTTSLLAQDARFTVVIDAGHGGHDPGAMGAISREKDINLDISLDLGAIIEQKYKDVKVVYTRKTDKYLTLQERADVVNNNHADLFICVHTNSAQSPSAYGAESFTLGLAKTKANLDVAMRENSVITLEENYKAKYQGFDPNSVDSYIMFEFMQDKYIDRSVDFASTIQKQFRNYCNRSDRGVRQAGFWVLHRSACPSVLVEVGFISNPAEERYLSSDQGQKEMATAIFNAFVDYKRDHDKKSGRQIASVSKIEPAAKAEFPTKNDLKSEIQDSTPQKQQSVANQTDSQLKSENQVQNGVQLQQKQAETKNSKVDLNTVFKPAKEEPKKQNISSLPVFKVQILASTKKLKTNAPEFKGAKNIDSFVEGGYTKYTVGSDTDYSKIEMIRTEVLGKFPEAFIIAFVGDKK
ncbi:MAG TPA: N-acetylmuramoyl-L-alanine amidase, partial [Paludibacter sp.]